MYPGWLQSHSDLPQRAPNQDYRHELPSLTRPLNALFSLDTVLKTQAQQSLSQVRCHPLHGPHHDLTQCASLACSLRLSAGAVNSRKGALAVLFCCCVCSQSFSRTWCKAGTLKEKLLSERVNVLPGPPDDLVL